ncbi:SPOR domain-containing protein [Maritalea sp. S77]|uniref:SPOR domain-containing protein n=1 Tax=Maritalea sp. S77 TaxID=3415125 RepID=UPI003C7B01C6
MADSKKPADQGLDQSDDLIAELARIVADDAKRATVSQSIEQRAQQERPTERAKPASAPSSAPKSAFADQQQHDRQQERQEREQREPEPRPTPAAVRIPPQLPVEEPVAEEPQETPTSAEPFEFDFSSNYREEPAEPEEAPADTEDFTAEVERLVEQAEREPQPEPVAPQTQTPEQRQSAESLRQEVNAAAEVDEIADLISQADEPSPSQQQPAASMSSQSVEAEQVEPVEPRYDHETDALYTDEPYMEQEEPPQQQEPTPVAAPPAYEPEQPAAPQAPVDYSNTVPNDPLAEIERLIEDTAEGQQRTSSPHSYLDAEDDYTNAPAAKEDSSSAAEAAILAAMAAARPSSPQAEAPKAQAPIGPAPEPAPTAAAAASQRPTAPYLDREQPEFATLPNEEPVRRVKKKKNNKLPLYAGGIATLLLVGLAGATVWNFIGGGQTEGDVPLVTAQNTDVKQVPENTGEDTEAPSVFSALEGQGEDSSTEQLVSRDDTDGASGEGVSRVITPSSTEDNSNGLTNRKVKTVTVLADGTIVTGDEASAGAQQLPDIRPNVPSVSGGSNEGTTTSTDPIGDAIQSAENTAQDVQSTLEDAASLLTGQGTDTADTTSDDQASTAGEVVEDAPTPPSRPEGLGTDQPLASAVLNNVPTTNTSTSSGDDQPLGLVPDSTQSTQTQPTSTVPVNTSQNTVNAPYYVQLASQRTPEAAQQTVSSVSRRFAGALGGQSVGVNRVDLSDRGVFYRVLVPANSLEAANSICNSIKLSGGDCFVRNN